MSTFGRWETYTALLLLVAVAYAALFVRIYRVDGPSMEPTLQSNQYVVVDTLWWRLGGLQRLDLAVFTEPKGQVDIKRVIGLPEQTVYLNDRSVRVVGQGVDDALVEPYVRAGGQKSRQAQYATGKTGYFLLGDNRVESYDSRVFGAVDVSNIIGHVLFIF